MTRDEYVRKAADRLAELRRPTADEANERDAAEGGMTADRPATPGGDGITDAMVDAYDAGEALGMVSNRGLHNWPLRAAAIRAGLEAVVPLLRARWEAEQCAITDGDSVTVTTTGVENPLWQWAAGAWPPITPAAPSTSATPVTVTLNDFYEPDEDSADVQAAFDAGEKGVTKRPPGWCRWHEMVDCHGDAPECREARAELDGADPCGDVYADGPPLSRHTCGRPSGHNGAHRCRCVGFENYTWPAGGGDE